jgi:hypothetical protein
MYYTWPPIDATLSFVNVSFVKNNFFARNGGGNEPSLPDHKLSKCLSGKDLSGGAVDHDVANKPYRINMYDVFHFMKQKLKSKGCTSSLIETV